MGRQEMLADEHRKAKEGNMGKYDYVDARKLERLGIESYKMKSGDNFVRVITPRFSKYNKENLPPYWKEAWIHSNIGADGRTFLCMKKMANMPCPVCEMAEAMAEKDPDNKAIMELWPGRRYLFFVYDVTDATTEQKGIHWLDAPVTFKEEVVAQSYNKRTHAYIDVSSFEEGMDVEFEKIGKGMTTKYKGFVLKDGGQCPKEWYDNAPDEFEEFMLYPTYEQVAAELPQARGSRTTENASTGTVRDPAPARTRGAVVEDVVRDPAPVQNVAPAVEEVPAPARTRGAPVEETVKDVAPARTRGVVEEAPARTRTRGGEVAASGIDPAIQARIDAIIAAQGE